VTYTCGVDVILELLELSTYIDNKFFSNKVRNVTYNYPYIARNLENITLRTRGDLNGRLFYGRCVCIHAFVYMFVVHNLTSRRASTAWIAALERCLA